MTRRTMIRRAAAVLGAATLLTGAVVPAASATPAASSAAIPGFPLDQFGRPTPEFADAVRSAVNKPGVPDKIRETAEKALDFLTGEGDGEPGVEIPDNAPTISQFYLPTAAQKCIGGESASVGLATAVPGPAALPLPGVGEGQTAFVFTGLGTKGLADEQQKQMRVHWVNPVAAKWGTTELTDTGINPDGPATVSGIADTGEGFVLAFLEGGFTADEEGGPANCTYTPTVAVIKVGKPLGSLPGSSDLPVTVPGR